MNTIKSSPLNTGKVYRELVSAHGSPLLIQQEQISNRVYGQEE
ncbi:hypothetical protein [Desulfobacula sp.]|nr:hypothetical protein [Desulfobacula sp.]